MNILVFANFPPYVLGGAENQVARLVDAWLELGHSVEVAGFRIPSKNIVRGKFHLKLHRIYVFKHLGRVGRALSYCLSLLIFLLRRGDQFDIIYCRGLGDAAISVCLAKAFRLCRLPLVVCPINAKGKGDINFLKSIPGWKNIIKLINRHCDAINIIAADIKKDIFEIGICDPLISEISNGIPVRPLGRKKNERKTRKIIFTGRLSHQKGIDVLIKALVPLHKEGYNISCDIIGDGPLYNELEQLLIQQSMQSQINFIGAIPGEEIREILLNADIFVMPSRYEGMSNSVLEAMEAGLPVLVTRCGGIDHYIDDNGGWTCAPDDVEELTNTIRKMFDTPFSQLKQMGMNNRSMVENNFCIQKIASQNIDLFVKVRQT